MMRLVPAATPAAGIGKLRNARIVWPHGWIVAEDDTYLPDHSWFGEAIDECPIYGRAELTPTMQLQGVTLNLCTDWSSNYGHLLFDSLPRLYLFERAGYKWDDVSHVLLPNLITEGQRTAVSLSGIPIEKIVPIEDFAVVECEELLAPTFPGVRRNSPAWAVEFWRSKVSRPQRGRRLFISRQGATRSLVNENEITTLLGEFGFETIVSSGKAIREDYQEAEMIVGAHGAALADILFCHPGTALIELTPPGHVYPYYYTVADSAGMFYFSILGSYPSIPRDVKTADFAVSPEILRATVLAAEGMIGAQREAP